MPPRSSSQPASSTRRKKPRHSLPKTTAPDEATRSLQRWAWSFIGLTALVFGWALGFPFVFDDDLYLANNPFMKSAASFLYPFHLEEFIHAPAKLGLEEDVALNLALRPLAYATFYLNHALHGLQPWGYRLVNLAIHAGNGWLLSRLLLLLMRQASAGPVFGENDRLRRFTAGAAALLFIAHPLGIESVTYIVQRFTSLGALFYLLTLLLHLGREVRPVNPWLPALTLLAGLLTKEEVITAPLIAVLIDWAILGRSLRESVRAAWRLLALLPLVPLMVVLVTWAQHRGAVGAEEVINVVNLRTTPWDHWQYALTQLTIIIAYLRRIVWPVGLNPDPEWPLYTSPLQGPVLLAFSLIVALLGGSVWALVSRRASALLRLVGLFVAWYFATIVISSGLVPLPDLMAEHRCYLPSLGIFAALALLGGAAIQRWQTATQPEELRQPRLILTGLVACLAIATTVQHRVWSNRVTFWSEVTRLSPGKARGWYNLGVVLNQAGRLSQALPSFQLACQADPKMSQAWLNQIAALNLLGRYAEALRVCDEAAASQPQLSQHPDLRYQRAVATVNSGQTTAGLTQLHRLVSDQPRHHHAHSALAELYAKTGQHPLASLHFRHALEAGSPDQRLPEKLRRAEQGLPPAVP